MIQRIQRFMLSSPAAFRWVMRLWPPLLGAGVVVTRVSDDWREMDVTLRRQRFKQNFVGTQFGGSLFAMTDPFYMLMLMRQFGEDHWVWDQAAEIVYLKPGRSAVHAKFRLDDAILSEIRQRVAGGEKHYAYFDIDLVDDNDVTIAVVKRKIYIRQKRR